MLDRRDPPREDMTSSDMEEGRRRIQMERWQKIFRQRYMGEAAQDETSPFTPANIKEIYKVRLYEQGPEENGG